jgi:hypothetical protein
LLPQNIALWVKEEIMNAKKYLLAALALSFVAVAFAASVCHHRKCEAQPGANHLTRAALKAPSGKFGPVIEAILPDPKTPEGQTDILSLETGRTLPQPSFEDLSSDVDAIAAWPRSHGVDISCFVLSRGAACITYDMTVLPVESDCWDKATAEDLLGNPGLAPVSHAPRRLLKVGQNHPDTYLFRTRHGILGMLRIVGVSRQQPGVTIQYKLINPPGPEVARNAPRL